MPSGARAADKVKAVASFSILGDMVKQVGGDRIDVITLVGPDGDAHVYEPTPADAKNLATAQILFTNGLGFEGWMDRLEKSSGFRGKVMVASTGVKPPTMVEDEKTVTDPHAWQSLANGKLYVANIRDGLIAVDPEGKSVYEANAAKYLDALAKEEADVRAALAALPQERRKIISDVREDSLGFLEKHNFRYIPSVSNKFMVDVKRPGMQVIEAMRKDKVYIGRVWPSWPTYVRVTVGTQDEMNKFKAAFLKVMA